MVRGGLSGLFCFFGSKGDAVDHTWRSSDDVFSTNMYLFTYLFILCDFGDVISHLRYEIGLSKS